MRFGKLLKKVVSETVETVVSLPGDAVEVVGGVVEGVEKGLDNIGKSIEGRPD